jgi:perosamine synthetase
MKTFIPQIEPWIDERELHYLKKVIDSTYVTEHKLTKEFEDRIKDLTGAKHAIAYTNGTVALYACLKALNIGPGDEVVVPNMTFIATSNAVLMAGANPIFCEIDPDTLCIDSAKIPALITNKTKAIMPVHLYGQSADMHAIMDVASKNDLFVIEDAAQGVGVKFDDKHVGTYGDLGILSFYGNKTITCGEGGVILTDCDRLKEACYRLKNHGRDRKGVFVHNHIGFNFCFTEMQAALGLSQLDKLPEIIARKKEIYDLYHEKLGGLKEILKPIVVDERTTPVHWFTSFLTKEKNGLQEYLRNNNVQTRDFFYPLNMQPCYKDMVNKNFPISEKTYYEGISLPSSYNLKNEQQMYIIDLIYRYFKK